MWSFRMKAPGIVERIELPDPTEGLREGEVRLQFRVGALCGSDMGHFTGRTELRGAPIHEVVGLVVESSVEALPPGMRVVGTALGAGREAGLSEYMTCLASGLIPADDSLDDVEAVTVQSLGTVLRAVAELPEVRGSRVAVIGLGPIGLCFCHILKARGAASVVGLDPIDRSDVKDDFGIDDYQMAQSSQWVKSLSAELRPDIVIDAVGHSPGPIRDALHAVAPYGFVYGFGATDDVEYALPYKILYERNVTLRSGRTIDKWQTVLTNAQTYLLENRSHFKGYISHRFSIEDVQTAYSMYALPQAGRVKVAIVDGQSV